MNRIFTIETKNHVKTETNGKVLCAGLFLLAFMLGAGTVWGQTPVQHVEKLETPTTDAVDWNAPTGAYQIIKIEAWGGGGGGGNALQSGANSSVGGGGGGGAYAAWNPTSSTDYLTMSVVRKLEYVVGAGGTGGNPGGESSISYNSSTYVKVTGGSPGYYYTGSCTGNAGGGAGGDVSELINVTGNISIAGGTGNAGEIQANNWKGCLSTSRDLYSGAGGTGANGGAGGTQVYVSNGWSNSYSAGNPGTAYGGGGSGAAQYGGQGNPSGGKGGDGAVWITYTTLELTVTFDYNYTGAPTATTNTLPYYEAYESAYPTTPVRPGYTFGGWYFDADATQAVDPEEHCIRTQNFTVYAKWIPKQYPITLHAGGEAKFASGVTDSIVYATYDATYGDIQGWSAFTLTWAEHSITGWYTAASGGSKKDGSDSFNDADTLITELWAHWAGLCKIHSNGGVKVCCDAITKVTEGSLYTISVETGSPTNHYLSACGSDLHCIAQTGYSLEGWYWDADFTSPATLSDNYVNGELYANWTECPVNVEFYENKPATGGTVQWNMTGLQNNGTYRTYEGTYNHGLFTSNWTGGLSLAGHEFGGFYKDPACSDGNEVTFETLITTSNFTDEQLTWTDGSCPGKVKLYAKWSPIDYELTLHADVNSTTTASFPGNAGSVTADITFDSLYKTARVSGVKGWNNQFGLLKTGYTFNGWWKTGAADSVNGAQAHYITPGSDDLYAHWTANNYTVTYNTNKPGSTTPVLTETSKTVTFDSEYGDLATPTCEGYTFKGWYLTKALADAAGDNAVKKTDHYTIPDDTTLFAGWTAKTSIPVNFNTQTTEVATPQSTTATFDATYENLPELTRTGYAFGGWYKEAGCTNEAAICTSESEHTLYAKWTANTYFCHLATNGGTIGANCDAIDYTNSRFTVTYDSSINSALRVSCNWTSPQVSRTGYDFKGWWTKDSLTTGEWGDPVDFTTIYHRLTDTTVYAKWKPIQYVCTLDLRLDGSHNAEFVGGCENVTPNNPNSQYCTFPVLFDQPIDSLIGCSINADLNTKGFKRKNNNWKIEDVSFTNPSTQNWVWADNKTMYAEWKKNTDLIFDVILDPNGGQVSPSSYEISYWYGYGGDNTHWTNKYGTMEWSTTSYVNKNKLSSYTPSRTGYKFDGWKFNGEWITDETSLKDSKTHTLVAQWTARSVEVTYNTNDGGTSTIGSVAPADTLITFDTKYKHLPTPTKDGYTFQGWFTEQGVQISDTTTCNQGEIDFHGVASTATGNGTITLYAHWLPDTLTVTLNSNGGHFSRVDTTFDVVFDEPYNRFVNKMSPTTEWVPVRDGYVFRGWYHSSTATAADEEIFYNTTVVTPNDHSLYARWEQEIHFVAYPDSVSCFGYNNGKIHVKNITGGDGNPYTVIIAKQNTDIKDTLLNVTTDTVFVGSDQQPITYGEWTVSVYDATHDTAYHGTFDYRCSHDTTFIVEQPAILTRTVTHEDQKCATQGSITLNPITGGTKPYTVGWVGSTNISTQRDTITLANDATSYTISNLLAQEVSLYVTDAHGCPVADTMVVIVPANNPLTQIPNISKNVCSGQYFSFLPDLSGQPEEERNNIRYTWSTPATTATVNGAVSGSMESSIHGTITNPNNYAVTCTYAITPALGVNCQGEPFTATVVVGPNRTTTPTTVELEDLTGCRSSEQTLTAVFNAPVSNVQYSFGDLSGNMEQVGTTNTYKASNVAMPDTCSGDVTYFVTAVDASSCEVSGNATLKVRIADWAINVAPGAGNVTCIGQAVEPVSAVPTTVKDGCNNPLQGLLENVRYSTDNGATWNTTPFTCAGQVRYTYSFTSCDDTVRYWTYTYNVSGMTTDSVVVSNPIDTIGASVDADRCLFQVPNLENAFRNAISAASTCSAPADITISQTPSANTYITAQTIVTVTLKDGCNRESHYKVIVTVPTKPTIQSLVFDEILCYGDNTKAVVTAASGTPEYRYEWSNGTTSDTIKDIQSGTYTVTVTDDNGCSTYGYVNIPQPSAIHVALTATSTELCDGGSVVVSSTVYGGTQPYTYHWTPSSIGNVPSTPMQELHITTIYTLYVKDQKGCSTDTPSVTVTVNPLPSVVITPDNVYLCAGVDTTLKAVASEHVTYRWSDYSDSSALVLSIDDYGTFTYTVLVTDTNTGCRNSDTAVVMVDNPKVQLRDIEPQTVCLGGNATFMVQTQGEMSGVMTYAWLNEAGDTVGTEQSYVTPETLSSGEHTFMVVVSAQMGECVAKDTATAVLTVLAPFPTQITGNAEVCQGDNLNLQEVETEGDEDDYEYLWTLGNNEAGSVIGFSDLREADFRWTTAGEKHVYVAVTEIATGCVSRDTFEVQVNPLPEPEISANRNHICPGQQEAALSVVGEYAAYKWNTAEMDATSSVSVPTYGIYTVTVTDANGCRNTASDTVYEYTLPTVTLHDGNRSYTICGGGQQEATLVATPDSSDYTYVWKRNGVVLDFSGTEYTTADTGIYMVTVIDGNGCYDSSNTTRVLVLDTLDIAVNNPVTCAGVSVALLAQNGEYYEWDATYGDYQYIESVNNGQAFFNAPAAGTYQVRVIGANSHGCTGSAVATITVKPAVKLTYDAILLSQTVCAGDPIDAILFQVENGSLSMSGNLPYNLILSSTATDTIISGIAVQTGSFNYTVIATSDQLDANCPTLTAEGVITVLPTVSVAITPRTQEVCAGGEIMEVGITCEHGILPLTSMVNAQGLTYQRISNTEATLSGSFAEAGTYKIPLTVSSDTGCAPKTDTVTIIVHPNPVAAIAEIPELCPHVGTQTVTANVTGATTGDYTYNWVSSDIRVEPIMTTTAETSNAVQASVPVICDSSFVMRVQVTDAHGCVADATQVMAVRDNTVPQITASHTTVLATPATYRVCTFLVPQLRDTVTVTDVCTGGNFNIQQSPAAGTELIGADTTVKVWVMGACGHSDTVQITIQKPAPLQVNVAADAATVCFGSGTTLTATTEDGYGDARYFSWEPNTGLSATNTASVTATPSETTTYTVTVRDAAGCSDQKEVTVAVYPLPTVTLSDTAICPNAGSVALTATAGNGGGSATAYDYAWSCENPSWSATTTDGGTTDTQTLTGFPTSCTATDYTVNVTVTENVQGCQATTTATVTVKDDVAPKIVANVESVMADIVDENCNYTVPNLAEVVEFTVTDNCSTTFTYEQSPAAGTPITASQPVLYIAQDACGNRDTIAISVMLPNSFTITEVTLSRVAVSCPGGHDGSTVITLSDGNNYSYWVDGVQTNSFVVDETAVRIDSLTGGIHEITAKTGNGCASSVTTNISEPAAFSGVITTTPASCANNDGAAIVDVTGGSPFPSDGGFAFKYSGTLTYGGGSYSYQAASSNPDTLTSLQAGHYIVSVEDTKGCAYVDSFDIELNNNLEIENMPAAAPVCSGGDFTVQPESSIPMTTYTWSVPTQSVAGGVTGTAASPDPVYYPQYSITGSDLVNTTDSPVILTYAVIAHYGVCTIDTTVVVKVRPTVLVTVFDTVVCPAGADGFMLTAALDRVFCDEETLTWRFNGEVVNTVVWPNPQPSSTVQTPVDVPAGVCGGSYPFSLHYTDGACEAFAEGTVTLQPTGEITIVAPLRTDTTVNCSNDIVPPHTVSGKMPASVTDGCGNTLTYALSPVKEEIPDPLTCNGMVTYTYTYTDCGGNSATYTYTYHVVRPEMTLPEEDSATVICESDAVLPDGPGNQPDACNSNVTPVLVSETPVSTVVDGSGTVTYTWTYTACDGNVYPWHFVYTVVPDPFEPIDTVLVTVGCKNELVAQENVPVPDTVVCGESIEFMLHNHYPQDNFNGECGFRTYRYDYRVNGENYEWYYIEQVVPEDFTMPANAQRVVACYGDINVNEIELPTVTDACGNTLEPVNPIPTVEPAVAQWTNCTDEVTFTYVYEDCQGHSHEWVFTWIVKDTLAPEFYNVPSVVSAVHSVVNGNCVYTYPRFSDLNVGFFPACDWNETPSSFIVPDQSPNPDYEWDYIEQTDEVQYLPMDLILPNPCPNGATATVTVMVEVPARLQVDTTYLKNVTCFEGHDAEVRVIATGGTPFGGNAYTYTADDDSASQTQPGYFTNISVPDNPTLGTDEFGGIWYGPRIFTATDAHGCVAEVEVDVASPVQMVWENCVDTVVLCADPGQNYRTVVFGEDVTEPSLSTTANAPRTTHTTYKSRYNVGNTTIRYTATNRTCYESDVCVMVIHVLPNASVKDSAENAVQELCPGEAIDPIVFTFVNADSIVLSGTLPESMVTYSTTQTSAFTTETQVTISGTPVVTEPTVYDYVFTASSPAVPGTDLPCSEATFSGSITIHDTVAPTYLRPADTTVYADANGQVDTSVVATGLPIEIEDYCTDQQTVTYRDESVVADCGATYHFDRVWRVADASGNVSLSDSVQRITVRDTMSPVIASGYATSWDAIPNQSCNSDVPNICDTIRKYSSDNMTSRAALTVTQTPVAGTEIAADMVVTITVTDECGNSTNTTVDVHATGALALLVDSVDAGCYDVDGDGFVTFTIQGDAAQYIYTLDNYADFRTAGTYTAENLTYGDHILAVQVIMPYCRAERTITVQPIADTLAVTANSGEWEYDTEMHENPTFTVVLGADTISSDAASGSEVTLPNGDIVTANVAGNITDAGSVANVLSGVTVMRGTQDVTCKYTRKENNGTLTVTPAEVTVTITGHNGTADYDGVAHTVTGYDVEISDAFYTVANFKFNGDSLLTRTDAGTSHMLLAPNQFSNQWITPNIDTVIFVVAADGWLTINPINVEVTVIGHTDTADYDGTAQTVTGYDLVFSTPLYAETNILYTGDSAATRTDAGTTMMGLVAEDFSNTNANFDTVTFNVTDGWMTILPIDVVVTVTGHNDTADFDGAEHQIAGYDLAFSTPLYADSNITFTGVDTAKRTIAGTTNMNLASSQFSNTNTNFATVTFNVTDGWMTILPIDVVVTVTGHTDTAVYDGAAHTVKGYDLAFSTPLYTADHFTFNGDSTATRTDVGTTYMNMVSSQFVNNNPNFATVTFNITNGWHTILPLDDVVVTITGHTGTDAYSGAAHTTSGYDVVTSTPLYTEADFAFNGTAAATRTHVVEGTDADGKTDMGLISAMFSNTNANFTNVTFNVTDGWQEITPINAEVAITGHHEAHLYDATEYMVTGYDVNIPNALYSENDFTFNGSDTAVRTAVGITYMGLLSGHFANINPDFATVTFNVTDGYMRIETIDVTVNIIGHRDTVDYGGVEQVVTGYDVDIESDLYTVNDFTFTGSDTAKRTDVGTTYMGLTNDMFSNISPNYGTVTFNVTDGWVTVKPIDVVVTVVGKNDTADYDGAEHQITGYDLVFSTPLYADSNITFTGVDTAKRTIAGTTNMNLASNQFSNTNANFATVTFNVTDGWMTILPIDVLVTVTGHKDTAVYDGAEHEISGYDLAFSTPLYADTNITFTGVDTAKRTDAGTTNMNLVATMFQNTNANFANVTFNVTDGWMTILPLGDVTVTIKGNKDTATYDATAHTITGYVATVDNALYNVDNSFTFNGDQADSTATRTEFGQTDMDLVGKFTNTNVNFTNVTFNVENGYQMIEKRAVTVAITGHRDSVFYDASAHTVSGYDVAIADNLYQESYFTFNGGQTDSTATRTDKGVEYMGLTSAMFTNNNANFDVTFDVTDGYMKIEPRNVVVTITGHQATVGYNGEQQQLSGYDVAFSNSLYTEADFAFAGSVADSTASGTNVGTYSMNLNANQFTNVNTTNFDTVTFVVNNGSLTIEQVPAVVTIKGKRETHAYDGQPHTTTGYTATAEPGFYGVDTSFTFSGTASATCTNVDTTYMLLSSSMFTNTNGNFSEVTFVIAEDGYQAITPIDVTVEVVGDHNETAFDGAAHTVTGYTATASDALYDVDHDFTFSGTATATQTNVGTKTMGLADTMFHNTNTNFANVTFVVTDGYQTITPINVVVTIKGSTDTVNYDGQPHTVTGYVATADNAIYNVNTSIVYSGTDENKTATRTEFGKTEMTLAASMFSNTDPNFANVTFNVVNGFQYIEKRPVTVTVTGHESTVFFDNEPHTVTGFDTVISDPMYPAEACVFNGSEADSTVTETVVGTFYMGLAPTKFVNNNSNFDVTFAVTNGRLIILSNDVVVTVRGSHNSFVYNGESQTVTGYEVVSINHPLYTEADFTFNGTAEVSRTVVGTDSMGLMSSMFANTNNHYSNVIFVIEQDGFITVTPKPIEVTVVGNKDTADFNGQSHTITGFTMTNGETLYSLDDSHFNGSVSDSTATRIDAGTTFMGLAASQFSNSDNNFDVTYVVTDGYMFVMSDTVVVTVTGETDTHNYDATEHTVTGFTMTSNKPEYDPYAYVTFSGTATASRTDAGTTNMGLTAAMFSNSNVNYHVIFNVTDGWQEIDPLPVTVYIEGATSAMVSCGDNCQSGILSTYTKTASSSLFNVNCIQRVGNYSAFISGTGPGLYMQGLAADQFVNNCDNGNFVVTIQVTDGWLRVLNSTNEAVVKIKGNRDTVYYNGSTQNVNGYSAEIYPQGSTYSTSDFTFNGTATASRQYIGVDSMHLTASQFENTNTSFSTVYFNVNDGFIIVKPIDTMVVTVKGAVDTVEYDGTEHTVTGYTAMANCPLFDASKVVFNGTSAASRTLAGTTYMGLVASSFSYDDLNFTNVIFNVTDGHQTVTKKDLAVTAPEGVEFRKDYDGTPLTVSYDQLHYEGLVGNDALTQGVITTESAAVGTYVCGAGQMWAYADNEEGVADASGFGEPSVTQNYKVHFNVTLHIDPVHDLECPEQLNIVLTEGAADTTLTESQLGTIDHALVPQYASVQSNILTLNPLTAGTHEVQWVIYDIENTAMDTCYQTVVVEYTSCEDVAYNGYTYPAKRIGSQCWMTENLHTETNAEGTVIADFHAYKDKVENLEKFGYLYTWYSAMNVAELDNSVVPVMQTGANGQPYVQGICPEGWAVPSVADYDILNEFVGDALLLKDAGEGYWYPGMGGVLPNSGYNSRAGGLYNSTLGRYEDILTGDHYWKSDSVAGSTSAVTGNVNYFCDSAASGQAPKTDRRSVRCIKKL